jgi:glycine cleavage system T protein (aminomethyltransferase)
MPVAQTLRRTPLFERHRDARARLVPFAGWEMPVQYTGIRDEHLAVRRDVGVFDVSHMGEVETRGPQARELLQRVLSNDLSKLAVGGAQYSLICREDGGVLDDTFTYRPAPDRYLTVTNASNHERDLAWIAEHADGLDCEVLDRAADYAMLAVQGPRARELVAARTDGELPPRMGTAELSVAGAGALACGTGYTGEDGVELLLAPDAAGAVWDALVGAGATPAGLGARDTLRTEMGYPLHGQDLSLDITPLQARSGWAVGWKKDAFWGRDALLAEKADGPARLLRGLESLDRGIPRAHMPVLSATGEVVGEVTSGTFSPTRRVGIGLALVATAAGVDDGDELEIDVRGRRSRVRVVRPPFVESHVR